MNIFVGITTSLEHGQQRLDHAYVQSVVNAGGVPILLPAVQDAAIAANLSENICAVLIPGGPGITFNMMGTLPDTIAPVDPIRWQSDLLYWEAAKKRNLPVLGICYGMQLMTVLDGGTLYADVERQRSGALVHSEKRGATTHAMTITPQSHLHHLLQTTTLQVNSRHLQAVCTLGAGYYASARSPDGVIEAIESEDGRQIGVQFHPEQMNLDPLFAHLITCAKAQ